MADHSPTRHAAEQRYEKTQKARETAAANLTAVQAEQRAVAAKTVRLKALRLARDAAQAKEQPGADNRRPDAEDPG